MTDLSKISIDKKILYGAIGIIIVAELVWAFWVLTKPSAPQVKNLAPTSVKAEPTSISLKALQNQIKVGGKIAVSIDISSSKLTDGSDLIILYDPQILTVIPDDKTQKPVVLGSLYADYPINALDEKMGKITVSGISSTQKGIIPKGVFGSVIFQAKQAGKTKISLDFTPDRTTDCNVIETKTAKDLLSEVHNLELEVGP